MVSLVGATVLSKVEVELSRSPLPIPKNLKKKIKKLCEGGFMLHHKYLCDDDE